MKYSSPYQNTGGAFAYAQNSIMKAIKSTNIQDDISNLKRDLNNQQPFIRSRTNMDSKDSDVFFRANKRANQSLSPIKERETYTDSNLKAFSSIANNRQFSVIKEDERDKYYAQKLPLVYSGNNYFNWLLSSFTSFKFDKMLIYDNINSQVIETTEMTVPLLTVFVFLLLMLFRGKCGIKCLYIFLCLLPIMNWFLMNQLTASMMKFNPQVRKIPLLKSITLFYAGFIPIVISSLSLLILKLRSLVGMYCLLVGIIYASFLSEKYHGLYCGFDMKNNKICIMLQLIIYSFFILVIAEVNTN